MDIKNTYKVRKTLIEMLTDRGYDIPDKNISYDEFIIMFENNNYDVVDKEKKVVGVFHKEIKAFSKKDLENIVQTLKNDYHEDVHIVIVIKAKYNVAIKKELTNKKYEFVEIFTTDELIINKTKHQLVPQHILLSEEEGQEVLEKYQCKKIHMPKILVTDPIAKYYGMKSGQICKIIRNNPTTGEYITYRYVR